MKELGTWFKRSQAIIVSKVFFFALTKKRLTFIYLTRIPFSQSKEILIYS